jgi:hypothetical protein
VKSPCSINPPCRTRIDHGGAASRNGLGPDRASGGFLATADFFILFLHAPITPDVDEGQLVTEHLRSYRDSASPQILSPDSPDFA